MELQPSWIQWGSTVPRHSVDGLWGNYIGKTPAGVQSVGDEWMT